MNGGAASLHTSRAGAQLDFRAQDRRLWQRNNLDSYPGLELPCFSISRTGEF